jgi:hypothetical protein
MDEDILKEYCLAAIALQPPQRKFKLFSPVKMNDRVNKSTGRIVGCQWWDLAYAFEHGDYPGWWYTIDTGGEHVGWHESQLTLAEDSAVDAGAIAKR